MLELTIKSTVLFLPDSLAVGFALMEVAFVDIAVDVLEFSVVREASFEITGKSGAVPIFIDTLAVGSAKFIDISGVHALFPLFTHVLGLLLLSVAHVLSHSSPYQLININI